MQVLLTRTAMQVHRCTRTHSPTPTHSPASPSLHNRSAVVGTVAWPKAQQADYFFDAARHTALSLKTLIKAAQNPSQPLGIRSNAGLTVDAMSNLVASISPRLHDDSESRAYFSELMAMHLSGLTANEIRTLKQVLKQAGFDGVVTESILHDLVYPEYGMPAQACQAAQRTLMLPQDWNHLLDDLADSAAAKEKLPLSGKPPSVAEAIQLRADLGEASRYWQQSDRSITSLLELSQALANSLSLAKAPMEVGSAKSLPGYSMLDWRGDRLLITSSALSALQDDKDGILFGEVLRDLLELMLARKMFGGAATPRMLSHANQQHLDLALQEVLSQMPATPSELMCSSAARVLARQDQFGKIQILPTTGVALGHAWIGHSLSVIPDQTQKPSTLGTRYMRVGFRLDPDNCTVSQWPVRWLSPMENAELYPTEHAWHIAVPVDAHRLEAAATQVVGEWKSQALPYRFIGTEPGMRATGCRISVLKAIQTGMEPEARTLFNYFNAGLAEPDSPTELAIRLNQFMAWLKQVASKSHSLN